MNTPAALTAGRTKSNFTGCNSRIDHDTLDTADLLNLKTRKREGNMGQMNHLEAKSGETGFSLFLYEWRL